MDEIAFAGDGIRSVHSFETSSNARESSWTNVIGSRTTEKWADLSNSPDPSRPRATLESFGSDEAKPTGGPSSADKQSR